MDTNTILSPAGQRISVIGCGGKTTLVNFLARFNQDKKVLIMTTTKILAPREKDIILCETLEDCLAHTPHQGIQCLGVFDVVRKKFSGPPQQYWEQLTQGYDLVLMEADGSRSLPCKGWGEQEPVIPSFTTSTVGIVTLRGLGKPADEENVLRVAEFCKLTGLAPKEVITLDALADMVGAKGGMFKNAVGTRVLLINQMEDESAMENAKKLSVLLREKHPSTIDKIYAGSIIENNWVMV